jgi:hypothetical protein
LIERYVLATQTTGGSDYGTREKKNISRERSVDESKKTKSGEARESRSQQKDKGKNV